MKHAVTHDLDQATARKAAERAWEAYAERFANYNPQCEWTTERHADIKFSVKGFSLKGSLDLEPGEIVLDLEVPFVLRVFKKQAIDVIEREIRKWVDKAKAGEI